MSYTSRIPELKLTSCPYDLFSSCFNHEAQWCKVLEQVSDSIGPGSIPDRDYFILCVHTGCTSYTRNNCLTIYQRRGSAVGYSVGLHVVGSQESTSSLDGVAHSRLRIRATSSLTACENRRSMCVGWSGVNPRSELGWREREYPCECVVPPNVHWKRGPMGRLISCKKSFRLLLSAPTHRYSNGWCIYLIYSFIYSSILYLFYVLHFGPNCARDHSGFFGGRIVWTSLFQCVALYVENPGIETNFVSLWSIFALFYPRDTIVQSSVRGHTLHRSGFESRSGLISSVCFYWLHVVYYE